MGIQSVATLDLFADLTGERRSTGKDIGAAVQKSMRDLAFSYQIGYYPTLGNWDDNFYKLRVTTKRKRLRIQAKTGYYASKSTVGGHSWDTFTAIATASDDAAEILRAHRPTSSSSQRSLFPPQAQRSPPNA
jgi:hypothetical protein